MGMLMEIRRGEQDVLCIPQPFAEMVGKEVANKRVHRSAFQYLKSVASQIVALLLRFSKLIAPILTYPKILCTIYSILSR